MADSYVVTGAMMMCTFGMAPSSLVVLPVRTKMLSNVPRGNIMDFAPMVNIMPFGMCNTPSNPTVAAATAAAMGVLTPMPCIPAITTPWMPGNPMVLVQGQPALTRMCRNMCMWGGQISFTTDGQMPGAPPMFVPPVSVMMPEPLTDIEKSFLMSDEQWAYNNEWEQAKYAGAGDRAVADKLDEIASHYEQAGEFDKATQARETVGQFRERADKKQAAAMEAVNNKYRVAGGQTEQVVEKPMTTEELQGIHDQATKEQAQYEQEISQIDKQLAQNQEVINKQGEELATVSRELSNANESLKAANQEKQDATEKREAAEKAAKDAEWNEESAKRRGDKEAAQYFHNQKKEAEKTAKEAAKEEEKASKKVAKAEKEYDSVSKEQDKAYNTFRDSVDHNKDLKGQKQTAENNRNVAEQKANAAQQALDAQDTLAQHDDAVSYHNETKETTREKREEKVAYEQEAKKNQEESDAWYKLGAEAQRQGNQDLANSFYRNDGEYHDKAVEASKKAREKEEEYNAAKAEMHEAYNQAYSDDALFDAYTAEMQFDKSTEYLKNNPSDNVGGSTETNESSTKSGKTRGSKNK
ncbi:MAG: DUF4280 domain-containing protein [Prevotella sp.]|nr:DUF4280 domain-containing protein [Prevotella sp.]